MTLPEPTEEQVYQQAVRGRLTALPLALGLMMLGALLLLENQVEGLDITLPLAGLILLASFALTSLFRFFTIAQRRERGLFFLAMVIIFIGGVLAAINVLSLSVDAEIWMPLLLGVIGAAVLLTAWLGREKDPGLFRLGGLLLLAMLIGLAVTEELIPPAWIDNTVDYFPLIIALVGVLLIPLALRRPPE